VVASNLKSCDVILLWGGGIRKEWDGLVSD
jgi:hypothetical protein